MPTYQNVLRYVFNLLINFFFFFFFFSRFGGGGVAEGAGKGRIVEKLGTN